jgi:hypothetical protein
VPVIADTGPLNYLVQIDAIGVLPKLFDLSPRLARHRPCSKTWTEPLSLVSWRMWAIRRGAFRASSSVE